MPAAVVSPPVLRGRGKLRAARPVLGWTVTVLRALVAAIFVWAAIPKLTHPAGSAAAVQAFRLFPVWLATDLGYGLPFLGLGLAVVLAAGLATRLAAATSAVVVVLFAVGVATAALRGLYIRCGFLDVGGSLAYGRPTPYVLEILRDDILIVALGFITWTGRSRVALDNVVRGGRTPGGPVVAVVPALPAVAVSSSDPMSVWRAVEIADEQRREGDWRLRLASGACAGVLLAVFVVGCLVQAARVH